MTTDNDQLDLVVIDASIIRYLVHSQDRVEKDVAASRIQTANLMVVFGSLRDSLILMAERIDMFSKEVRLLKKAHLKQSKSVDEIIKADEKIIDSFKDVLDMLKRWTDGQG